jgi:hypothetical protein
MVSTVSDSHGIDGTSPFRRWAIGGLSAVAGVVVAGTLLAPPAAAQGRVREDAGNSSSQLGSHYGDDDAPLDSIKWDHHRYEHKHHGWYEHKHRKYDDLWYQEERKRERRHERKREREREYRKWLQEQEQREQEQQQQEKQEKQQQEKLRYEHRLEHRHEYAWKLKHGIERKIKHKQWLQHRDTYKQKIERKIEQQLNDVRRLSLHLKIDHESAAARFLDSEEQYAKKVRHNNKLEQKLERELKYLRGESK